MSSLASWRRAAAVLGCIGAFSSVVSGGQAPQQPPSEKDLSTVIEMLGSPDPVVRVSVACARNVFNPNAAAAIPVLIDLLDDAEPVSPEVCREDHRRWWGDEKPITAGQESARALVRIGIASFDRLVKALQSAGATARRNAAWALGALDDSRAVMPLVAVLGDADESVREQASWALGALGDARAVQPLVGRLRDAAARVRRQAAWALGAIDDAAAVDALVAALTDADAHVREQAAWALGAIGDARASAGLSLALKDNAPRVRRQSAWALGAIAN
jgi:HEAT repeat protein